MLMFCPEIESPLDDEHKRAKERCHKLVPALAQWYQDTLKDYSSLLSAELSLGVKTMAERMETLEKFDLKEMLEKFDLDGLNYTFSAKSAYFSVSDALMKLILCRYSYGLTSLFANTYGLSMKESSECWLDSKLGEATMTEIVAKVLRQENVRVLFDLQTLMIDRPERHRMVHVSESGLCMRAIRCYRTIREMLIFLNPDYSDRLPVFGFPESLAAFNSNDFRAEPGDIHFGESFTVLVVGSLHDTNSDSRKWFANLPWDVVIDTDGYSDCGGLLADVNHNRIQKEYLNKTTAQGPIEPIPGKTLWFRCGQYQDYMYYSSQYSVTGYVRFLDGLPTKSRPIDRTNHAKDVFGRILEKVKRKERFIQILMVTDDATLVRQFLETAYGHANYHLDADSFFLTWVGVGFDEENAFNQCFDNDPDERKSYFRHISCSADSFFREAEKNGRTWNWKPRGSSNTDFSLPVGEGKRSVVLQEDVRRNLEPYFEVLYRNCQEEEPERADELRREFYQGHLVSWNTIQMGDCFDVYNKMNNAVNSIKTLLGETQQRGEKRIFLIKHTAGMGGTTLARQIAWRLHNDYAVLSVRKYNPEIRKILRNLYDNYLERSPLVLLADETLVNIVDLCSDMLQLDRRCVLIVSCRSGSGLANRFSGAQSISFTTMNPEAIPPLQRRFKEESQKMGLTEQQLALKDQNFELEIGDMLSPFIIGLYYMDKDFNIDGYVNTTLSNCGRQQADALACLALCDCYGQRKIPASFVRKALDIPVRQHLQTKVPTADSLICYEYNDNSMEVYKFKHFLLSERFLEKYCEKYYQGKTRNAYVYLAKFLVDKMALVGRDNIQEEHTEILISLLISDRRRNGASDDTDSAPYSKLITDISDLASQLSVLERLTEKFQPMADEILRNRRSGYVEPRETTAGNNRLLRLVSHSYAHRARMLSRSSQCDYSEATDYINSALEYRPLEYRPNDDSRIFHMAGDVILHKLASEWDDNVSTDPDNCEMEIRKALNYFDQCIEYNSADYGLPSKLDLIWKYLLAAHQFRQGLPPSSFQIEMRTQFLTDLAEAESYDDFNTVTQNRIKKFRSQFESNELNGDYGQVISYYRNQCDKFKSKAPTDYANALRGLIFAYVCKARKERPDEPFCRSMETKSLS